MSKFSHISLSALELPSLGEVPDWVHLVPKGNFGASSPILAAVSVE